MRVRLIARWREAWRFSSVRLSLLLAGLLALEPYLPQLTANLPDNWAKWLAFAIVIARVLLVQTGAPEPIKAGGTD